MDSTQDLGIHVRLQQPYEVALERVKAALKGEGFGVLTEIDVQATLKQKIDVDFRRYIILGACNPPLAYRALSTDLNIGLLLPCNVVVYETVQGESVISLVDPVSMSAMLPESAFSDVARDARERFERIADKLRE